MARLLVSSCNLTRGGIYFVNTASGKVKRIFGRSCRGMALGPDGIYAVLEERGIVYRIEPWTWEAARVTNTHLHGAHDLRWIDGSFYVVGCKGNVVARFDPGFEPLDRFTVVDSPEDVCHANCLTTSGESLLLCVFTLSPGARETKNTTEEWRRGGKLLRLDWESGTHEIAFEPLAQPHSIQWRKKRLYVCESYTSEICSLRPARGDRQVHCRLEGFVRGLAFSKNRAFVGISRTRPPGEGGRAEPPPAEEDELACAVLEMDATTWETLREVRLPDREIYDILVLDEERFPPPSTEADEAPEG
jgi:hypothetical protein